MGQTQYYTATTLDGFIADPDHSLEWLFSRKREPRGPLTYEAFIAEVGAIAMGSTTYEWILDHELLLERPEQWRQMYADRPTWVFTHRDLPRIDGADIRFVRGDVRPVHREMVEAAKGKNVWLVGGGELVGQFHDHGLLDELIIQVAPVTLGAGAPLLPRAIAKPPLRLTSVTSVGGTFAELRYEVPRASGAAG